ncbi:DC-STAMP domain-containing protein 2-like [Planococcus citri]|uniref:DC-STAMP domain-containing protein 2-like n=1 Tax=Planococcus citri TaxID=170843 RepID=UPI0031F8E24A
MHMIAIGKLIMMRVKVYRLMRAKGIARGKSYLSFIDRLHYWNAKWLHCGCIKTHFRVNRDKPYIIKLFKMYVTMTTAGTFPHFVLTAILGFIGGIILSYAYFFMSAVVLDMSTYSAFYVSAFLCIFLTIGMAFFEGVRCVVMSVLPETCTSRARAMLISIALFLLISGPGSNILFNTRQLTDTIACTQEQVGAISHNLTELYKKPIRIMKQGISYLMKSIKPVIDKLKSIVSWIKDAVLTIARIIKKVSKWLAVFKINCHTIGGIPLEICTRTIDKWLKSCEDTFWKEVCSPIKILTWICFPFKTIATICAIKNFIKENIFDVLKAKIKDLGHFLKTIFYVKVSFHHSYNFKTNQSKSLRDVYKGVHESQKQRLQFFLGIIHFMKFVLGMYIAYVLITAFIYRYRFFYQTRYDNRHVNQFLIDLDTKRATINRQTLFPLTASEKTTYVALSSLRLTALERRSFLRGSVYLIMACLKTSFIFLIDVFLFFILDLVHNHGRISFYFGRDKSIFGAEGSGFFYTLYSLFNNLFNVFDIELRFDTGPCLPQAIPVDYLVYQRIAVIMGFAWVMSLMQPFALRFRNYVMSNYYPHIARRRAVWLYNHILQTRGVFSQYVRRTLFTRGAIGLRSEKPDPYKWLIAR